MTGMQAIILAGGFGTRLQEVVSDVPKPMAPVGGKPFLEYLVNQLVRWSIRDIILSVGYKRDVIKAYFGDGSQWGVRIRYSEEDAPLGTGGAIREATRMITGATILVLNGDSYFDLNFDAFHTFHAYKKATLSMALVKLDDTGRYGRVDIDKENRVLKFQEKQGNEVGFINSGIYLMNTSVLAMLPEVGLASFEKDVLLKCKKLKMYGMSQTRFFVDIGIPEGYHFICNTIGCCHELSHPCRILS
jgi:D-glycero-alpha-D-manno-heptose 1-phosphate guanylyltransferase